ncbi:hypothetical protein [uncultured Cetobacterium sp.]|uniref:hypothetical protein n=1 Tax=uncultured Cetobacterium sp. TaxID=527638 RepID=UPI0025DAA0DE|nr:hypothetical protein [uncultured Cetobacterium sp.]
MKKIIIGIMALSTLSLAANPAPGTALESQTASVPVRVIAELIPAPYGLTITDEAGTVLDELILDHGRMVLGQATGDSTVFKPFKVKRFSTAGTAVVIANKVGAKLKVSLKANTTDTTPTTSTTLKLNGTSTVATEQLTSNLSLLGSTTGTYEQTLQGSETELIGRVTSKISQATLAAATKAGIYHNGGQHILEVVYTPGN